MKRIAYVLLIILIGFTSCKKESDQDAFLKRWTDTNCGTSAMGDYYKYGSLPCPNGYHIPLQEEFRALMSYPRRYATTETPGGVPGVWFGLSTNNVNKATANKTYGCIFFPKTGYEWETTQGVSEIMDPDYGYYWSSSIATGENIWRFVIMASDIVSLKDAPYETDSGYYKFLIRCIKDEKK